MQKLWGGRFTVNTNQLVEDFTASITFDYLLAKEDILGSIAHAKMLGKCKILAVDESDKIATGLKKIFKKNINNDISFSIHDEDIHLNVERLLTEDIGEIAGKLHTARSRNDQVALDIHLYLRAQVISIVGQLLQLQRSLLQKAEQYVDVVMPGYTHLQRAQPVLFSQHLLAYATMLQRDIARLCDSWPRVNSMPLGAGALAGTGFPIDRRYVADLLGFDNIYENSMDAVSDRDFIIEFLSAASLIMMHLSRLSEELIIWSSDEFAFIELDDAYCTGSSMMPQKKNPDVPELIRGKTGRVYGALFNLLTILKGLPLAYNKDLQEDKEPLFDTVKTVQQSLVVCSPLISSMHVKAENMLKAVQASFVGTTDIADYLVHKGMPFRQSHSIVGKLVQHCLRKNKQVDHLTLSELKEFSPLFSEDIFGVLEIKTMVNARNSLGGTALDQVKLQLEKHRLLQAQTEKWLLEKEKILHVVEAGLL